MYPIHAVVLDLYVGRQQQLIYNRHTLVGFLPCEWEEDGCGAEEF